MLYKPEQEVENEKIDDLLARQDRNFAQIKKIDGEAKNNNELLHRFLFFPYADGKAIYQIVKVQKRTVRVNVCTGIGDDWVLPLIGEEGSIALDKAMENINRRDALAKIFSQDK